MPLEHARNALASHWFDRLARFGYASKGLVFGVVGILAIRVGLGEAGEQPDFPGALGEIGEQPLKGLLLIILAAGLLFYGTWRIVQGLADLEEEGSDVLGWLKRLAYVGAGTIYGMFGIYAVGILGGWSTDNGEIRDLTAQALGWPMGQWLVGAVGAVVIGSGLAEIYFAISRRFEVELGRDDLGRLERACLLLSGGLGHLARGAAYCAAGVFAIRAAIDFDPDEARGLAETFQELATQPYGWLIVSAIAAGFIAFGFYCLLLAFHRHIPNEGLMRGRGRPPAGAAS
jgi:hypothetical protein